MAQALRVSLQERGLHVRDAERPPLDHRFVVSDPSNNRECTVEVFPDGGRLRNLVILDIGSVLHPDDLAADKLLALWGRARPRDFYDVHALLERFGAERLMELAGAKDAGFSVVTFLDALNAINRLTDHDWAEDGISTSAIPDLQQTFADWHRTLSNPSDS